MTDAIPLRRSPTDLRGLLGWSLDLLRKQAEAFDIGLRIEVDENVPAAIALDYGKIAWAVTALVGNALRYVRRGSQTMPGGCITVHASYDPPTRTVSLAVQDDGPGIAPDRLPSLVSDSTRAPGSALGLAMVRDVVAAHGGALHIDSETERSCHGTTVWFTLPVAA